MSNKTQLQTNNTALDGYIARINAAKEVAAGLPEAGGGGSGGSVETWTGRITPEAMFPGTLTVYYTDSNMTAQTKSISISDETTLEIAANTIIFIAGNICNASSGCTRLGGGTGSYAYLITANNFVITVPM